MTTPKNIVKEVIERFPNETSVFIANHLGISTATVLNIAREYDVQKLPLLSRNPSLEFLASYYNISLQLLLDIEEHSAYLKPFPSEITGELKSVLTKRFGKPLSKNKWDIIFEVGLEGIRYVIINYPKLTNSALASDLKCNVTIINAIGKCYSLEKADREEMLCNVCRTNTLAPREYKSGNVCKKCWTKRMSEYQYFYYPTKKGSKKK